MEPVQRKKLYREVLDRLTSAIATGTFPPGSQLPSERELMTMIGVGRPSIREAMLTLQQMGLIRISQGERARVIGPTAEALVDQISLAMIILLATSPRGLEELKEARLWMEVALVRVAAGNAMPRDLEALASLVDDLRRSRGDPSRFLAADMAFHAALADLCGNAMVAAVLRGMLDWLSRFKQELVSAPGAEQATIEEHERIVRAVAAGDAEEAAAAMADHINRASSLYRASTDQRGEPAAADGNDGRARGPT